MIKKEAVLESLEAESINELNERQKIVLREVCDSFISTGIPVGSRTLSKSTALSCSPATLRNEMADLEGMGYLCSPHTSAGRIPTEKGYKFYVNFLIEFEKISQLEETLINRVSKLTAETHNRQRDILQTAIKLACQKTNLAGVLLVPQKGSLELRSIKLIRILENKAMLITVDECGSINDQIVPIPPDTTDDVLEKLSVLLNAQLCQKEFHQYEQDFINRTRSIIARYNSLLAQLVKYVKFAKSSTKAGSLIFDGMKNFLEQPEFNDPERIKEMVLLLNEKENLLQLLANSLDNKRDIMVNIGSDSGLSVKDMSFVTARYKGPSKTVGKIGLIGPLRMDYARVVSTLARLSNTLTKLLSGRHEIKTNI